MPYGTILTDVIQSSTAGTPPQFNDGNSVQIGTLCRAWVNFVGSTAVISGSFNVSSVTRHATGDYTVTFTNAMPNANYSVCGIGNNSNAYIVALGTNASAPQAGSVRIVTTTGGFVSADSPWCMVSIFR